MSHPILLGTKINMTQADLDAMSTKLDCVSRDTAFDHLQHQKSHYYIGVHILTTPEETIEKYAPLLETYLTQTAGHRFEPPISFEVVPLFADGIYKAIEDDELDFVFANPGIYSCMDMEWGAQSLVTGIARLMARGMVYELDVYGGVIFTRADNDIVNTIYDLKGKIIGAGSPSVVGGGQLPIYEMTKAGMSYVMDPKQMIFVFDQNLVVEGVMNGDFDVGFVQTRTIEQYINPNTGRNIDPDRFKVRGNLNLSRIYSLRYRGGSSAYRFKALFLSLWPLSCRVVSFRPLAFCLILVCPSNCF